MIAPFPPDHVDYGKPLAPPSLVHLFGTDDFGRDVFSRVIHGARISLGIGLAVAFISTLIGLISGMISGFLGGSVDTFIMRAVDLFMAFPPVIVAMVLATMMGSGMVTLMIALTISGWTGASRLARGEALSLKNSDFIRASKAIGCRGWHLIRHHAFPNILPPVLISSTLTFGRVVLNIAGLSFIGIGVKPPLPEWGTMISEGREFIVSGQWWVVFFPGAALITVVMGLNLLGDGLRDILDPRQRR
jgi:peptide/nickel transport system permease protein